jgi:oxygen-dependent protoporphyrinogen oxidase
MITLMTPPEVIVVGGGIAGLATAYELHRQQVPFLLLEASPRLGGVIFSEPADGFTVDGGPDALLVQKPEGIRLCEELGLGDRLVPTKRPRLAFIQRGGRLHGLPAASVLGVPTKFGPFITSGLFSWAGKLRMGAELFVPRRRDQADESIGAFMTRRFGREATDYIAEPLLAGIHAGDVDRLSIRALFPRFTDAEAAHGSLLRAFRQQPPPPASNDGAFRSLPGGLSELVHAVGAALPAGCARVDAPVIRIRHGASGFCVELGTGEAVAAPAVVLATPAYVTAAMVAGIDDELSRLCSAIEYASAATIALAFERGQVAHPLNGSGFVVPRVERTGILAASWLSSKWPHRAPEGRVLMRTFVGGARDPQALERTDEELVAASIGALAPLLRISGAPLFTRVYRWPKANAQHNVGHLDQMSAIDRAVARHPGLYLTGSAYRGVGIPDCIADARRTARQAAAALNPQIVKSSNPLNP